MSETFLTLASVDARKGSRLDESVRSPPPLAVRVTIGGVRLGLVSAAVGLSLVWAPVLFETIVTGELDPLILVLIPLALAFVAYVAFRSMRVGSGFLRPKIFAHEGFEIFGHRHPWKVVDCVYSNPSLNYITVLFKELQPPQMAGIALYKKAITPSVDALLALVRANNIPIHDGPFTVAEMADRGYRWARQRAQEGRPPIA